MTSVESRGAEQFAQNWVLDAVQMGLIVLNNEGQIVLFNHWMAQRSGLASAEVVGRTLDDVFPEVAKGRVGKAVQACLIRGSRPCYRTLCTPHHFPCLRVHHSAWLVNVCSSRCVSRPCRWVLVARC